MLQEVYPNEKWRHWKFPKVTVRLSHWKLKGMHGYWKNCDTVKEIIKELESTYKIHTTSDWYRISHSQLLASGSGMCAYDTLIWSNGNFQERWLVPCLVWGLPGNKLEPRIIFFPRQTIRTESVVWIGERYLPGIAGTPPKALTQKKVLEEHYHPLLSFPQGLVDNRRRQMQLDVFVPSLNLAFEYHGIQHYSDHPHFGSAHLQQKRDTVSLYMRTSSPTRQNRKFARSTG